MYVNHPLVDLPQVLDHSVIISVRLLDRQHGVFQDTCTGLRTPKSSNLLMWGVMPLLASRGKGYWQTLTGFAPGLVSTYTGRQCLAIPFPVWAHANGTSEAISLVEGKAPWLPDVASTLPPHYLSPDMHTAFPSSLGNLAPSSEKCIWAFILVS